MPDVLRQIGYRSGARGYQTRVTWGYTAGGRSAANLNTPEPANRGLPHGFNSRAAVANAVEKGFTRGTAWVLGKTRVLGRLSPYLQTGLMIADAAIPVVEWALGQTAVPGVEAGFDFSGFGGVTYCVGDCAPFPNGREMYNVYIWSPDGATACQALGPCIAYQVPAGYTGSDITLPYFVSWLYGPYDVVVATGAAQASGDRFAIHETWRIPGGAQGATLPWIAGTPGVDGVPSAFYSPAPLAVPFPALDPFTLPIQAPVSEPAPLPWRLLPAMRPNPFRAINSERGYRVGRVEPKQKEISVELTDTGVLVSRRPPRLPSRPSRTREHKVKGGTALERVVRTLQRGAHSFTEMRDFINAIYNALPKRFQTAGKKPQDRVRAILEHWRFLDPVAVVQNLEYNELEDRFLGRAFGKVSRGARRHGVTLGPGGYGLVPGH